MNDMTQRADKEEARYREVVERLNGGGVYPPVAVERNGDTVWLVCATGHRWGAVNPDEGCHQCQENERFRLMGRTECKEDGCREVVKCSDVLWEAGVRQCRAHWESDQVRTNQIAGPVCLDELVTVIGQYPPNVRWNGWLQPRIDAWSVEEVLTAINAEYALDRVIHDSADIDYGYAWEWLEGGSLKLIDRQWQHEDPDNFQPEILRPDEDGLYALGAGSWTWSEDPEFYDTERAKELYTGDQLREMRERRER